MVAIRAAQRQGGGVAIYGPRDGRLVEIAVNEFIGRGNRWLNIAALADITGDGKRDVAYVRTPHIGGALRLFSYKEDLNYVDEIQGFSNHAIGAREQRLSAVADIDGDGDMEIAVQSDNLQTLRLIDYQGGLVEVASVDLPGRIDGPVLAEGAGIEARLMIRLIGGQIIAISR